MRASDDEGQIRRLERRYRTSATVASPSMTSPMTMATGIQSALAVAVGSATTSGAPDGGAALDTPASAEAEGVAAPADGDGAPLDGDADGAAAVKVTT